MKRSFRWWEPGWAGDARWIRAGSWPTYGCRPTSGSSPSSGSRCRRRTSGRGGRTPGYAGGGQVLRPRRLRVHGSRSPARPDGHSGCGPCRRRRVDGGRLHPLSRSTSTFAGLIETSQREGWGLVALDLGVDTAAPQGEMMANLMALFARFEWRLIGQRTQDAQVVKRESLSVKVRHSKTDQAGEGAVVAILPGSFADTCPVRAVAAWRAAAGISDGALFRRVDRHGRLLGPMSSQAVAMVIARAAERAGLTGRYRSHSLRRAGRRPPGRQATTS